MILHYERNEEGWITVNDGGTSVTIHEDHPIKELNKLIEKHLTTSKDYKRKKH